MPSATRYVNNLSTQIFNSAGRAFWRHFMRAHCGSDITEIYRGVFVTAFTVCISVEERGVIKSVHAAASLYVFK